MIGGWLALGLGLAGGALGTTLAVGVAAVNRLELSRWVAEHLRGERIAGAVLSAPGRMLGAANAVAALGTVLAGLGIAALSAPLAPGARALAVAFLGIPAALFVIYVVPRAVGRRWAEGVLRVGAPWLDGAARLFTPLMPTPTRPRRAELAEILRARGADDRFAAEELTTVSGVMAFTERSVREIMTPRTEIVAVAEGAPLDELAMIFAESGYSRVPVYRGSLDNIVGMVYAFDLLKTGGGDALPVRPVTVAPASRRCADLLLEMQRESRQFAVVLDEFGGTAGIVTFEDLLEELVGEIFDEHDLPAAPGETAEPPLEEFDGTVPAADVAARFDAVLPAGAETLGGLLARVLGRIPAAGERIALAGLEFDVLAAGPTRVERVVVRPAPVTTVQVAAASPPEAHA